MNQNNREFSNLMKKRICELINDILDVVKALNWKEMGLGNAREQLVNASISIGANYIEAVAASSTKEFARFIGYSLRSANETQYWLQIIHQFDSTKITGVMELIDETAQIASILATSIKTMRSREENPPKTILYKS
jgi:four helix bundle protein